MMASESKIVTDIPTRLVFSKRYPYVPPSAFVLGTMFLPRDASRHFMSDESCCLGLPGVDHPWDPADQDALKPWLDQLIVFYQRQLIYDRRGEWSGPQWPHGYAAYAKHLEEVLVKVELIEAFLQFRCSSANLSLVSPCPCDSGAPFADCHRAQFAELLPKLTGVPEAALRATRGTKDVQ